MAVASPRTALNTAVNSETYTEPVSPRVRAAGFTDVDEGRGPYTCCAAMITGLGFLCLSIQLFAIGLILKTLARLYYPDLSYQCTPCPPTDIVPITQCDWNIPSSNTTGINDAVAVPLSDKCRNILLSMHLIVADVDSSCPGPSLYCGQFQPDISADGSGWNTDEMKAHMPGNMPLLISTVIYTTALAGTFIGSLLFGYIGDCWSRMFSFYVTICIICLFGFTQVASNSDPITVISVLIGSRILMGIGIGGDYALSATMMSEWSPKKLRGTYLAGVFAMQGVGYLVASSMSGIFTLFITDPSLYWRVTLFWVSFLSLIIIVFRYQLQEPLRFRQLQRIRGDLGPIPINHRNKTIQQKIQEQQTVWFLWEYKTPLFVVASTWFLMDIAFYSLNFFQADVLTEAAFFSSPDTMTIMEEAQRIALTQILTSIIALVGYVATAIAIDYPLCGRLKIQCIGFLMMTLFMGLLFGFLKQAPPGISFTLFAFAAIFANFGPNTTTYVLSAEIFPTNFRALGHGISGACGKAGAIVGVVLFEELSQSIQTSLAVITVVNVVGLLISLAALFYRRDATGVPILESTGKTLEAASADDFVPVLNGSGEC